MRILALAGAILSVWSLAVPTFAQSTSDQLISSAKRAHDFGTVARAAKTEHHFEIRNPFKQPMHLRSISASCGCTTPIIESEWIQPGQVGTVMARFNTGTFTGDRKASLNLVIDQPSYMQVQLNVKGYIRSDIVINPGELNFGTVPEGQSKQIEANIEYAGRIDWKLTSISSNADFISASFTETARSPGRVAYKLIANLAPGAEAGIQATQLTLHTNDSRLKTVPLCCIARIEAPLSVSPNQVALGEMKAGQSIQQRLLIKGREPFRILDVSVPNMTVKFDPTQEPKAIQFLNVTLIPEETDQSREVRTTMVIMTDMDGERDVSLDVSYKVLVTTPLPSREQANLSDKVSSRSRNLLNK